MSHLITPALAIRLVTIPLTMCEFRGCTPLISPSANGRAPSVRDSFARKVRNYQNKTHAYDALSYYGTQKP